jgi:hypothetical protein
MLKQQERTRMAGEKYDILIPVEMYPGMGFYGKSARPVSTNGEMAFSLRGWQASFHETPRIGRYIIVRTDCPEAEARAAIEKIVAIMPFVSVILDAGMRVTSNQITVGGYDAQITGICLFTAGISPHTYGASGSLTVQESIEHLTQAFAQTETVQQDLRRAAEVFADVDFEASTTSRMVLVATALELICSRASRDADALALIEGWQKSARGSGRGDLVTALDLMRQESIASAIKSEVKAACARAKIGTEETDKIAKRTAALYGKRSAVVHRGAAVSAEEVAEFRYYVRFLFTGTLKRGAFSGVLEGVEREKSQ